MQVLKLTVSYVSVHGVLNGCKNLKVHLGLENTNKNVNICRLMKEY